MSPRSDWWETIRPAERTGGPWIRIESSIITDGAFVCIGGYGHVHLSKVETRRLIHHLRQTIGE